MDFSIGGQFNYHGVALPAELQRQHTINEPFKLTIAKVNSQNPIFRFLSVIPDAPMRSDGNFKKLIS